MKKVKILLSAIIILSVVGGVFAFKASRGTVHICTILPQGNTCTRSCMGSVLAFITTTGTDMCVTTVTTTDCTKVKCPLRTKISYEE